MIRGQRQLTVALGWKYAELSRWIASDDPTVAVYDEVSILNEIAAVAGSSKSGGKHPEVDSIDKRLERLVDLRASDLINDDEYLDRRSKLLDEI